MKVPAMEKTAQAYLPLSREWKWPKLHVASLVRSFGDAFDLCREAYAMAYVTALVVSFDAQNNGEPRLDEDLEGRDPRW